MNQENITKALLETPASPIAREEGERLMLAYTEHYAESYSRYQILDVERSWHLWLDEFSLLVGQKDARLQDSAGPLLLELKTKKESRRTKAGDWYKGESPLDWLESISNGPQLGIYALHEIETTGADHCRVMVRAAVKSSPVLLWPEQEADGIFILSREYCQHLKNSLLVRAAQIRAARGSGKTPWQWVGYHCRHMFGKDCAFYENYCSKHLHPNGRRQLFSATDPGGTAIQEALLERGWTPETAPAELVILSASAYEDYSRCMERGRLIQDGHGADGDSIDLQIGSCFHAGVAAWHRELMSDQNVPNVSMPDATEAQLIP